MQNAHDYKLYTDKATIESQYFASLHGTQDIIFQNLRTILFGSLLLGCSHPIKYKLEMVTKSHAKSYFEVAQFFVFH